MTKYSHGEKIPNTRLTFIKLVPRVNPKIDRGIFQCDCGNLTEVNVVSVTYLASKSCGCLRREMVADKNTKHNNAKRNNPSGSYRSWAAMHQRVIVNPRYSDINVCDRWSGNDGFRNFLEDMGERPDKHSIERINNLGDYEPNNCKWATHSEQMQNTSTTKLTTINGETHSISEWCRILNISYGNVKQRRLKGMSLEDALLTPLDESKRNKKRLKGYNNE